MVALNKVSWKYYYTDVLQKSIESKAWASARIVLTAFKMKNEKPIKAITVEGFIPWDIANDVKRLNREV